MKDPELYVDIELDKPRTMYMNMRSLKLIQKEIGMSVTELGEAMESNQVGIDVISVMIWAALVHEDPQLKVDDVDNMLDGNTLNKATEAAMKAFAAFLGDGQKKPEVGQDHPVVTNPNGAGQSYSEKHTAS